VISGCKVSPEAYGHFTHLLTALAGGRVILSLEGGYNVTSISYAMPMCTKSLLGDPLPPLALHRAACPSAVASIKNVIRTQARYWSALCFQVALPQERVINTQQLEGKPKVVLNSSGSHPEEDKDGAQTMFSNKDKTETERKVSPSSSEGYDNITAADNLCHTLSESLSKLCLDEKQMDPVCSDISTSPVELSSYSSPISSCTDIESQSCSKSSSTNFKESSSDDMPVDKNKALPVLTLTDICSISPVKYDNSCTKLSFSDDGYKSEEQSDVTFNEGTVISPAVTTEHGTVNAADGENKSRNDSAIGGQQGQSEDTGESASGGPSQTSGQQTLSSYLSENKQVSFASLFTPSAAL
jgi:hypothetical protein